MATSVATSTTNNAYQVLNQAGAANQAKDAANSANSLQNQFLKMLITQLQNQDPLNPMDSSQTTTQMAQISTVGGIQQLNSTMTALSANMSAGYSYQATSLIGHQVLSTGDRATSDGKTPLPFSVDIPAGTALMNVAVFDSKGNQIDTFSSQAPAAGNQQAFEWDGKDANGNQLPAGEYIIRASLTAADGSTQNAKTYTFTKVNSVSFGTDGVTLSLDNGNRVPFTKITQVI